MRVAGGGGEPLATSLGVWQSPRQVGCQRSTACWPSSKGPLQTPSASWSSPQQAKSQRGLNVRLPPAPSIKQPQQVQKAHAETAARGRMVPEQREMDRDACSGDTGSGQLGDLCLPDISGKQKKSKWKMSEQKKSQSLDEAVAERPRSGQRPPLSRSKTYDPLFSKEAEKEASASAHHRNSASNLMKHAVDFHRVFKDLSEEELLLETFSCAWQREVSYHGRLYVSPSHVCFYCSMVRREVKVVIPVPTISVLKKANTVLLVPNAICIRTSEGEKFLFGSLRSRETVYQLLCSVCKHLQDGSRKNSPTMPHVSPDCLHKISLIPRETDATHSPPQHKILPEEPDVANGTRRPPTAPVEQQLATPSRGGAPTTKSWRNWKVHLNPLNTVILIYLFL
ncbi:uncharacterized protein LOC133372489 isoform X2 [Rhineura floridana]|nr:uncharacterized protein LOC133372489 isoform X2 [Rhineura floridana]